MIDCCVLSIFSVLFAFFVGAIPTGMIIASLKGVDDLHERGSKNIGATNVGRVLGLFYFFVVFAIDAGKAYGTLWLLGELSCSSDTLIAAASLLIFGNIRSPFLWGKSKGGKGVASAVGIISFLAPWLLPWLIVCWVCVLMLVRRVGIASVAAAILLFFFGCRILNGDTNLGFVMMLISAAIIWRHRTNISEYARSWYEI